jgi:hypothetical protein
LLLARIFDNQLRVAGPPAALAMILVRIMDIIQAFLASRRVRTIF